MEISHSSGGWKSVIRVLAYGVSVSSRWQKIPFSYLHMRKVSQYFFFFPLEVLIPSMRAPPSWLNYLPKFYVQRSSQWGLDFNRWIGSGGWWGERTTDISVPNSPKFFLFLKKKNFYWAVPGLNFHTRDLRFGMRDLVSWPGTKLRPSALGIRSLSHWTTREVPPNSPKF